MHKLFQTKDVCSITGCSHRQLQYWEKKGYIKPGFGKRNIRYYSNEHIDLIKKIIYLKKKGKSLGEAFIKSKEPAKKLSALAHLENMWLNKNNEIIKLMEKTTKYKEKTIKFPYSVYSQDSIDELKHLQDQIKYLIKQRDYFYQEILQTNNITKKATPKLTKSITSNTNDKKLFSLDQLVLIWLRKKKQSNINEVRQEIKKRLANGESLEQIYSSIQ